MDHQDSEPLQEETASQDWREKLHDRSENYRNRINYQLLKAKNRFATSKTTESSAVTKTNPKVQAQTLEKQFNRAKRYLDLTTKYLKKKTQPDEIIEFDHGFMEDLVDYWNETSPFKCRLVKNIETVGDTIGDFLKSGGKRPMLQFAVVGHQQDEKQRRHNAKHYHLISMYENAQGQSSVKVHEFARLQKSIRLTNDEMLSDPGLNVLRNSLPNAASYTFHPFENGMIPCEYQERQSDGRLRRVETNVLQTIYPETANSLEKLFQQYHPFNPYAQALRAHNVTALTFANGLTQCSSVDCGIQSYYHMKKTAENSVQEINEHENILKRNLLPFRNDPQHLADYEEFLQTTDNRWHSDIYKEFQQDRDFAARQYPDLTERINVFHAPLYQSGWSYKPNPSVGNLKTTIEARKHLGDDEFGKNPVNKKWQNIQEFHDSRQTNHENSVGFRQYNAEIEFFRSRTAGKIYEYRRQQMIDNHIPFDDTRPDTHGLPPQALPSFERRQTLGR